MDIQTKIQNKQDFNFKFADAPFDSNGVLSPGWAEPTYDDFFTRMVETPVLLNQSTVLPMTAIQHDLDMLTANVELDSQRDISTGQSIGLTPNETAPGLLRKQLVAQPLQAKTIITDNFLEENIEGDRFMDTYLNILADSMGPAFERFGIFSDKNVTTVSGEGTGYRTTDGLLSQLKAISSNASNPNYGLAKLIHRDRVGEGVLDAIERYVEQDGNISNATCVLPPQIYARLMIEIAQEKETDLGDAVYQNGEITQILGITIVQDNIIRETRNGYNTMKFDDDGEYSSTGTAVDKMLYGFIGQPNNVVFGMMRDFEVRNQWEIDVLGYKVALLCKGDAKILWDQDTLAIPFTMNKQD